MMSLYSESTCQTTWKCLLNNAMATNQHGFLGKYSIEDGGIQVWYSFDQFKSLLSLSLRWKCWQIDDSVRHEKGKSELCNAQHGLTNPTD